MLIKQRVAALLILFCFLITTNLGEKQKHVHKEEEEGGECAEPDFSHLDILGIGRGAKYDDKVFHYDDGSYIASGENIRMAKKGKLRASVHTCRIKITPGVREWIKTRAALWEGVVEIQAFSQPPSILFVNEDDDVIEIVHVLDGATVSDISALFRSRGLHSAAADIIDTDELNRTPVKVQEVIHSFEPEPDMAEFAEKALRAAGSDDPSGQTTSAQKPPTRPTRPLKKRTQHEDVVTPDATADVHIESETLGVDAVGRTFQV